MKQAAHLH